MTTSPDADDRSASGAASGRSGLPRWRRVACWSGWRRWVVRVLFAAPLITVLALVTLMYIRGIELDDPASSTPTTDRDRPLMVALGDSFISGEGAERYLRGTDRDDNTCHRANTAYPYLVAAEQQFRLVTAACSGAITDHILTQPQHPRSPPGVLGGAPQVEVLESSDLHDDASDIDYLVVSIGGNDAGFGDIVLACLNETACQRHDRVWMARLNGIAPKVRQVYETLASKTPDARRIVMTYPQILVPDDCIPRLEPAEIRWVNGRFLPRLRDIISHQAAPAGFEVVDNTDAFLGARVCEDGVRVEGRAANVFSVSGVRGNPSPAALLRGSFHPTGIGHVLLAAQLDHQLGAVSESPEPCDDLCPPSELPPDPPVPPPGTVSPFPAGTDCVGDLITSDHVGLAPSSEHTTPVPAAPRSVFCYRSWEDAWRSDQASPAGVAALSTEAIRSGVTTSMEVLTQGTDDTWVRTVVIASPEDEIGKATPFDQAVTWAILILAGLLALLLLPWVMTGLQRLLARRADPTDVRSRSS